MLSLTFRVFAFIMKSRYRVTETLFSGFIIDDGEDLDKILNDYYKCVEEEKRKKILEEEQRKKAEEEQKKKAEEERQRYEESKKKAEEARRKMEEEKQKFISQMLITSGYGFEGYKIIKYSRYISGDGVAQISRGSATIFDSPTNTGQKLKESLSMIRSYALKELQENAYELGCNAIIGVDYNYITLDPETANMSGGTLYMPYVFAVTANGTAVVIEKDE